MAGVVMNPVQASGTVDISASRRISPPYSNNTRFAEIFNRLLVLVRDGNANNIPEICRLCVSLSRGIDHAVANNEIPEKASELPTLLKQVYQWKNNTHFLLTSIMVLLISMKGACRSGWYGEKDNEELHTLWNEIAPAFCSVGNMNSGESRVHHCISTVMSRFYPRMKIGDILTVIEATPGYGVFVEDFYANTKDKSPDQEVYLFVAQPDNTETSSCITSPQLVNFLLNGKAVDRRTCLHTYPGPQIPTLVTELVKPGTNLLQAVGQFNGKYLIVVALMSMISNPSFPALPDYTPSVPAVTDSDNDIVEGPSRISLNCPISFKRIVTPVKGHLCKHLQCFDFENYVKINSSNPSWRCPHCSQSVCFTDLRVDQVMSKVLKEVAVNVSHVKISAGGLWKAVDESDGHADKQDKSLSHQQSTPSSVPHAGIMDLTKGDNDNGNDIAVSQEKDKKPSLTQLQDQSNLSQMDMDMNWLLNLARENVTSVTGSNVTVFPTQTVPPGYMPLQPRGPHAIRPSSSFMNPVLQSQSQNHMQFQQLSMNLLSNDYGVRYMPHGPQHRPQRFSRFQMDQHQMMNMGAQDWVHQDLSNILGQPAQQFGANPGSSFQPHGQHFNLPQHPSVNHMTPTMVQSPSQLGFTDPTIGQVSYQQAHHHTGQQTSQVNAPAEQNWRPTGRMRGSLSGQAYLDALNQAIVPPTQPDQADAPLVLNTPRPVIPPHLQTLLANSMNAGGLLDGAGGH